MSTKKIKEEAITELAEVIEPPKKINILKDGEKINTNIPEIQIKKKESGYGYSYYTPTPKEVIVSGVKLESRPITKTEISNLRVHDVLYKMKRRKVEECEFDLSCLEEQVDNVKAEELLVSKYKDLYIIHYDATININKLYGRLTDGIIYVVHGSLETKNLNFDFEAELAVLNSNINTVNFNVNSKKTVFSNTIITATESVSLGGENSITNAQINTKSLSLNNVTMSVHNGYSQIRATEARTTLANFKILKEVYINAPSVMNMTIDIDGYVYVDMTLRFNDKWFADKQGHEFIIKHRLDWGTFSAITPLPFVRTTDGIFVDSYEFKLSDFKDWFLEPGKVYDKDSTQGKLIELVSPRQKYNSKFIYDVNSDILYNLVDGLKSQIVSRLKVMNEIKMVQLIN